MKDVGQLVSELGERFPVPPTDHQVRGQGFDYIGRQWTSDQRWPSHLPRPAFLDLERGHVTRADVFQRARTIRSEEDAIELYVMMAAWGAGTKARPTARARRPLHEPGAPERLMQSVEHLRSAKDAVEGYRRLLPGNQDRIKYFGPAFFTKWLYFAGADLDRQPLILDALVATAIGSRLRTGWSPKEYDQYLQLAGEIRDQWVPNEPTHVVEYALFHLGRSVRASA
ncbi:hypothetical protein [Miniimonas sp. S16]|uniref:8-oxoguanine DNA glycosylase OGG fold protein n=1 Tax=Miniimonas sp. S16 TaxID=2171623 RepID=UPI00131F3062|nr:hypothetical protein [Miniimonas sp. S16]